MEQQITQTTTSSAGQQNTATQTSTSTNKSGAKKIILIIAGLFGLMVIACIVFFAGIIFFVGNNKYSKTAESFINALDEGDSATVKNLSDSLLYEDLYYEYDEGTIASYFENNVENFSVKSVKTNYGIANLIVEINLKDDSSGLEAWNRIDLRDSATAEKPIVVYIGPADSETL